MYYGRRFERSRKKDVVTLCTAPTVRHSGAYRGGDAGLLRLANLAGLA